MTREDLIYHLGKALKETMAVPPRVYCKSCDASVAVAIDKPLAETLIYELERYGLQIVET